MSSFSAPVGLFLSENQGTFGETSIDDSLNLIFSLQTAGCCLTHWPVKAELFSPGAEAKMLSHLKKHSSSNVLIWWTSVSTQFGTTECKSKRSRCRWNPQNKRQKCPRLRHSTRGRPQRAPRYAMLWYHLQLVTRFEWLCNLFTLKFYTSVIKG